MFGMDNRVSIIDFGLSRKYRVDDFLKVSEDLRGTDPYLAPESLFYKYDKFYNTIHSDVFGVGVLLL
jgi:serine/threonine protein kinase